MTPTQRPARENELRRVYGAGGRQRTHRNKLEAVADVQVHPGVLYERAADEALRWCRSEHAFRSARRIQPPPQGRSASTSTSTDEMVVQREHVAALHRLLAPLGPPHQSPRSPRAPHRCASPPREQLPRRLRQPVVRRSVNRCWIHCPEKLGRTTRTRRNWPFNEHSGR